MHFFRFPFRSLVSFSFLVFTLSFAASAQQTQSFSDIKIKNFGQMDERFYRGAEPKSLEDFAALKRLGIRTIIDLQDKPEPDERDWVQSLGMQYVNIPMVAKKYPQDQHVTQFLKVVDDPSTGKFFVHCAGGRHRTGAMGAVYRFNRYGWDYDQVYKEMKQFDFYTRWGHGDFKKFVENYWQAHQGQRASSSAGVAASSDSGAVSNR